jgi:peptidoglycan-associated lipoprotein
MNIVSKKLLVLTVCVAALAGCAKKPVRPTPADTTPMGNQNGANLYQDNINTTPLVEQGSKLEVANGVIEDADTIRGLLQPVYFDLDKSNIKESERAKLQEAVKYLKDHPQQRLLLEGHCDWRGTSEYNLSLGDRRANAAKSYLATIGLGGTKVETVSKGSLEATKNGDDAAMAKDRRVDLVILKK